MTHNIKLFLLFTYFLMVSSACNCPSNNNFSNQSSDYDSTKKVGGGCDGCELMYFGMPQVINSVDTSSGWYEKGQKLLITGFVFNIDGKTPAKDVIVYYWQTDNEGYYSPIEGMDERAKRHGHIRGWVKSDEKGKYAIYTLRPAPYPNSEMSAHIHISIREPDIANEYYIDEFVFDDDKLLTTEQRRALENRGGSGVLRVLISDDIQIAEHNIILGLNIPNYPKVPQSKIFSGLNIGEEQPSFIPFHAWGPDKGSRACPVCKYGRFHGVLYFVGNNANWDEIKSWLVFLENESVKRKDKLKVYFVYGNSIGYSKIIRNDQLVAIGKELNLSKIALTFVPSFSDLESEVYLNKIDPDLENAFIIFRHRAIIDKYVGLKPTLDNFNIITQRLDLTEGEYFDLPEPHHD